MQKQTVSKGTRPGDAFVLHLATVLQGGLLLGDSLRPWVGLDLSLHLLETESSHLSALGKGEIKAFSLSEASPLSTRGATIFPSGFLGSPSRPSHWSCALRLLRPGPGAPLPPTPASTKLGPCWFASVLSEIVLALERNVPLGPRYHGDGWGPQRWAGPSEASQVGALAPAPQGGPGGGAGGTSSPPGKGTGRGEPT